MKWRIVIFSVSMLIILATIGLIFWQQEVKYALPTPVPTNFIDTKIGQSVDLSDHLTLKENRKSLLHFFNYDCPCSKFNIKDFERIAKKYEADVDFYVIIQDNDTAALSQFKSKYQLDIPTILDKDGAISDICGIYATPQAVILTEENNLYFKGNYNKARFCTRKETRFVDMAMTHLINDEDLPPFFEFALVQPYGCSLPSDEHDRTGGNFFNL